jgi:hypothetical protein
MIHKGKEVKTMDCTPTWEGILPLYLDSIKSGKEPGYSAAMEELTRMAQHADKYNEILKTTQS